MKGGKSHGEKLSMVIATNLISICCVYKEKIVKNDSYKLQINRKFKYLTRIVKESI